MSKLGGLIKMQSYVNRQQQQAELAYIEWNKNQQPSTPPVENRKEICHFTYEDMMDIAGFMAAADNKRPIPELKEEAEVYIGKRISEKSKSEQPAGVEKAAKVYADFITDNLHDNHKVFHAFKQGAEWQLKQKP